jgi:hypothetical protein
MLQIQKFLLLILNFKKMKNLIKETIFFFGLTMLILLFLHIMKADTLRSQLLHKRKCLFKYKT